MREAECIPPMRPCGDEQEYDLMKIFAGGIETETNTFSPIPIGLEDFDVQRGSEVSRGRVQNPSLNLSAIWGPQAEKGGHELLFSLMASAKPAGLTVKAAYETLRDELLRDLNAALPVDVVLLNLHGAMIAQGYEDCEQDLLQRVRELTGSKVIIGVELDLHCHLTQEKIAPADVVILYKEYPHVDMLERARELFDLSLKAASGKLRPCMALFDCRMIGLYPTTRQPMREIVDAMTFAERRPGVLSVSFGHGFQFADHANVGAKMLVVTDNEMSLAEQVAREFGHKVYSARHEIGMESVAVPLEEALSRALVSSKTPVVVADQSDNPGGGAPGDATYALSWLLEHDASNIALALLYDPEVVSIAKKAGVGATLPVRLGGKLGRYSGAPLDLDALVLAHRENYSLAFPQEGADPWFYRTGDVAALRVKGVDVIVSSRRCQCFSPLIFSDLGIDPNKKQALIVKSVQHFYGAFAPIASEVIYMAAPGAVNPDPRAVPYRRLDTTHLYPWIDDPLLGDDS
jgi:microcystin degradation protein MlrC